MLSESIDFLFEGASLLFEAFFKGREDVLKLVRLNIFLLLKQIGNILLGLLDCLEDVCLRADQLLLQGTNVSRHIHDVSLKLF